MLDRIPEELLPPDATRYGELIAATETLRAAIRMWQSGTTHVINDITGGYSPIFFVRRALEGLPDSVPAPDTDELAFLADQRLIDTLRDDISNATGALRNGEWKAATVMAGSVIEALLLWSITQHEPVDREQAMAKAVAQNLMKTRRDSPDRWHLADYIEVAGELNCIADGTRIEARRTRDYRNLIHPGRAQRTGEQCDLGTAHVAFGAMNNVIRDLTAKGTSHVVCTGRSP
jgi:hypothetical protein